MSTCRRPAVIQVNQVWVYDRPVAGSCEQADEDDDRDDERRRDHRGRQPAGPRVAEACGRSSEQDHEARERAAAG